MTPIVTSTIPKNKVELIDKYGITGYVSSGSGVFVVIRRDNIIEWLGACRIEFEWGQKRQNFHNRVGFKKSDVNITLVKHFWMKVFKKLGKASRFTIKESNFKNLFVIDLPEFWNENETVRSLFSLLLRGCLCYYNGTDDVISTMKLYPLAEKVTPAIEWFLNGNTVPTYEKLTAVSKDGYPGFVAEFTNATQKELSEKLIPKTINISK